MAFRRPLDSRAGCPVTSRPPRKRSAPGVDPHDFPFISHAAPEDNTFTIWLGAKFVAMGYEVWAYVLPIKSGYVWQLELENALRQRACKMHLVTHPRLPPW